MRFYALGRFEITRPIASQFIQSYCHILTNNISNRQCYVMKEVKKSTSNNKGKICPQMIKNFMNFR